MVLTCTCTESTHHHQSHTAFRGKQIWTLPAMTQFISFQLGSNYLYFKSMPVLSWHANSSLVFNPTALRKAKIAYNFGLSGCSRVKQSGMYRINCFHLNAHTEILNAYRQKSDQMHIRAGWDVQLIGVFKLTVRTGCSHRYKQQNTVAWKCQ